MANFGKITGFRRNQIPDIIKNIDKAIDSAKPRIPAKIGRATQTAMIRLAPVGVRGHGEWLRGAIALKINKTGENPWSEVYIKTNNKNDMIAIANELGVRRRKYFIGEGTRWQNLREWARRKVPKAYNNNFIVVGGANTRLGRQNKFIKPTLTRMNYFVPRVIAKEIQTELRKKLKGGGF